MDNVILGHELIKSYSKIGISPKCTMKVDLKKGYGSLNWNFLKGILLELGLAFRFVTWVMECITDVSHVILFNGGITPCFQAKKGLRQGDIMSIYVCNTHGVSE